MAAPLKLSRVQRKGQVTIPLELRQRLGIEEGDFVAFVETETGILITPQKVVAAEQLEKLAAARDVARKRIQSLKKP
jgi:AbrB family looped-hinge helix DNA binding protein